MSGAVTSGAATSGAAPRWASSATLPASFAGLGASAYLTYAHYSAPTVLACPDSGVINCAKVTTSPESMLFGVVPVAIAGVAFFAAMVLLTLPASWASPSAWVQRLRLTGAVGGIVMVVYLVFVEAVRVHALCLWCTAVHVLAFALFVGVLAATLLRVVPDSAG